MGDGGVIDLSRKRAELDGVDQKQLLADIAIKLEGLDRRLEQLETFLGEIPRRIDVTEARLKTAEDEIALLKACHEKRDDRFDKLQADIVRWAVIAALGCITSLVWVGFKQALGG